MDRSMEAFVERQNVERYIDQLKTETDPLKRNVVLKLLAEEEEVKLRLDTPRHRMDRYDRVNVRYRT